MAYKINMENALSNRGNWSRLKQLMKRAQAGEKLTLGFLGGSITQGCLASSRELCYAFRVYEWWRKTFPQAEFEYVNAGIGGTTSQFGAARVDDDLLDFEPDFVIIEFSVNDTSTEHFRETYEGVVRRVYGSKKQPAVLIVHNVYYDSGANAQLQHAKVGRHYDLPCVSMQSSIFPEVVAGHIENREITEDDLHPNDTGHGLVASVICYFLQKVLDDIEQPEDAVLLAKPLTENSYEFSKRYRNDNISPKLEGFFADEAAQDGITDVFKRGWYASEKGSRITFAIEGTGISVQYKRGVACHAPTVKVMVDGNPATERILSGNFPNGWGDELALETITEHDEKKVHTVTVELIESGENPFYLVSILGTCN